MKTTSLISKTDNDKSNGYSFSDEIESVEPSSTKPVQFGVPEHQFEATKEWSFNSSVYNREQPSFIQPKLKIGSPNDKYEKEADAMADLVVQQIALSKLNPTIQRSCEGCRKEKKLNNNTGSELVIRRKLINEIKNAQPRNHIQTKGNNSASFTTASFEKRLMASKGQGSTLPRETRYKMESAFGADFSQVKIHTNRSSVQMNQQLGAQAFTHGSDIYFNQGKYDTTSIIGNRLLAHELTHTVQQGASLQKRGIDESSVEQNEIDNDIIALARQNDISRIESNQKIQLWPGDGIAPPGDCSWSTYLPLLLSVNSSKAIVSGLGRCRGGDSCLLLATKIAAISAEIAARVVRETTCFRGGDSGHRREIEDKVNMMNRCYRFFTKSGCPQELIGAMTVVVLLVRQAIDAIVMFAAAAAVIGLVALLIFAIIVLAEVILAAAAAVTAEAVPVAIAAAIILLLGRIQKQISRGEGNNTSA